jgi:sulfur dioxygenase
LGHVEGAKLIPLGALSQKVDALKKDQPIVVICRSGARSAQATLLLGKAGFDKVANLSGGMLRWRAQRFPVEGGTD